MTAGKKTGSNKCITDLRRKAERGLRLEKLSIENMSEEDVLKAVNELRVHQVELEMQNEELRKAQVELEESRNQYTDLFDFAPVGYFVLDTKGGISQVNLTGASMVGIERSFMLQKPFTLFVCKEDKDIFYLNRQGVLKTLIRKRCDLKMLCKEKGQFYAELLIEPIINSEGKTTHCRVAVIDISLRKMAEQKLIDYQNQLRHLSSELLLSEERIRRKVAVEVHDDIAQNLAIAKMKLESLSNSSAAVKNKIALKEISELIYFTIENIRSLTFELSDPILYEFGFIPAVQWLTENIQKKHGIFVEFKDDSLPKPLKKDIQIVLFHAVRELLINVVKHASAKNVKVTMQSFNNNICIKIMDDGIGFDTLNLPRYENSSGGFGLFCIRESLDYIGAKLEIESFPRKGTTFVLEAPLDIENMVNIR
jgi:PAS domain S-box-containing protein